MSPRKLSYLYSLAVLAVSGALVALTLVSCAGVDTITSTAPSERVFAETFEHGPGIFTVATRPSFATDVVDGTYRIRILGTSNGSGRSYVYLGRDSKAIAITADVAAVTPGSTYVGLICAQAPAELNQYAFVVGTGGGFLLGKYADGQRTVLRQDQTAPIPGPGTIEQIRLTCVTRGEATTVSASVNGATVATVTDPHGLATFSHVGLLLLAGSGAEVRFDTVSVRIWDPGEANLSETP